MPTGQPEESGDVGVRLAWKAVGEVRLDQQGTLVFPTLLPTPGIYRMVLRDRCGGLRIYIGETGNLRKRASQYVGGNPSRQTVRRIHETLRDHLAGSGMVQMYVAGDITVLRDQRPVVPDLTSRHMRLLVESAAVVCQGLAGIGSLLNR